MLLLVLLLEELRAAGGKRIGGIMEGSNLDESLEVYFREDFA